VNMIFILTIIANENGKMFLSSFQDYSHFVDGIPVIAQSLF